MIYTVVCVKFNDVFVHFTVNCLRFFINDINKNHPTIEFTIKWAKISTNFLQVTVYITEGIIETDLYVKPTDSQRYIYHLPIIFSCKITFLSKRETVQPSTKDHLILSIDDRNRKSFPDVPLTDFKNKKSLRDHLARSQLLDIKNTDMS